MTRGDFISSFVQGMGWVIILNMSNYLFVDGSNLYAGQYKLFGPDKYLDFGTFE